MLNTRIVNRYAAAFVEDAINNGLLEEVVDDSTMFVKVCRQNREFRTFTKNPVISHAKKLNVIRKIFLDAFNDLTFSFIELVTVNKREVYLEEIFKEVIAIYKDKKSIIDAEVTTVVEIDDNTKKALESFILKLSGGDKVEIVNKIDDSIIGGFALRFKDKLFDASVASKLKLMKKQLIN